MTTSQSIYDRIGEDGFARLVRAFYAQVPSDDILGPMYPPDDMEGAEQRLRDFLVFRFGGPDRYIQQRGHPQLRARHMGFPIDAPAAERWLEMMDRAFGDARLPESAEVELREFFRGTARFLINRGEAPAEPMTELQLELEDGVSLGVTAVLKRQLPPHLEAGTVLRLSGSEYTVVRAERAQPTQGTDEAIRIVLRKA